MVSGGWRKKTEIAVAGIPPYSAKSPNFWTTTVVKIVTRTDERCHSENGGRASRAPLYSADCLQQANDLCSEDNVRERRIGFQAMKEATDWCTPVSNAHAVRCRQIASQVSKSL